MDHLFASTTIIVLLAATASAFRPRHDGLVTTASYHTSWPNSTTNVHSLLTFDGLINPDNITTASMLNVDFVWGGSLPKVDLYHRANPSTIVSKYTPYNLDVNHKGPEGLAWYKKHHPTWVVYKCDRKTPAWMKSPPGRDWAYVPLDVTNPEVVQWQLDTWVKPARDNGYDAFAWDVVNFRNLMGGCGVFTANGTWVAKYSGNRSVDVPYMEAIIHWLATIKNATNKLVTRSNRSMMILPNVALNMRFITDENLLWQIGNATNGVLYEGGTCFMPNATTTKSDSCLSGQAWVNQVRFAVTLQQHGKAYYMILHAGKTTPSCSDDSSDCVTRRERAFIVATELMLNHGRSAVYISGVQYGGWSQCEPECSVDIGTPLSGPTVNATSGLWSRHFSNGVVLVNPESVRDAQGAVATAELDGSFVDAYGSFVNGTVALPPLSALILMRSSG